MAVLTGSHRGARNTLLAIGFSLFASACVDGGPAGGNVGSSAAAGGECSVAAVNQWVDDNMRDYYLYANQVPVVNLTSYATSEELVYALRVDPDVYSYLTDQAQNEALVTNSSVTRFGFFLDPETERLISVSRGSPMDLAGAVRGDKITAINGVNYSDITDAQWNEFIRKPVDDLTATFDLLSVDGTSRTVTVTKASYTEKTVHTYGTRQINGANVGYLRIDSFRQTTAAEINTAVDSFVDAGITELVLDLRYNGGGFTSVALDLASQIVGSAFVGEVYAKHSYNSTYSSYDFVENIEEQALNLNLPRVVVLATRNTASASEMIMNGIAPYIDVVVIGSETNGKPFTSFAQDTCGKRLHAMSSITTNASQVSVLGGIAPTCVVEDDNIYTTDSINDALAGAAFNFIQSGACPAQNSFASIPRDMKMVSDAPWSEIDSGGAY